MKAYKLDRDFLLGLSMFLNQMQLSIDRSPWPEFVVYVNAKFSIDEIVASVNQHFTNHDDNSGGLLIKPEIGFLNRILVNKNHLFDMEEVYIHRCLLTLIKYLTSTERLDRELIVDLRCNLALASDLTDSRVSSFKDEYLYIEHCNRAEHLERKSIEEILGKPWPWPKPPQKHN